MPEHTPSPSSTWLKVTILSAIATAIGFGLCGHSERLPGLAIFLGAVLLVGGSLALIVGIVAYVIFALTERFSK